MKGVTLVRNRQEFVTRGSKLVICQQTICVSVGSEVTDRFKVKARRRRKLSYVSLAVQSQHGCIVQGDELECIGSRVGVVGSKSEYLAVDSVAVCRWYGTVGRFGRDVM